LISDRAKVFGDWAMAMRQICWAHLIRKFVDFSQRAGPAQRFGKELLECAHLVFHDWHAFKRGELTRDELWTWIRPVRLHFENTLERARIAGITEVSGSCADVLAHREALWTFVTHEGVEPTNNHAERALRPMVLWRKRSFGCQSERGQRFVERIMTVAATARKQGHDILDFLRKSREAACSGAAAPRLFATI
jgi:transposase